MFYVTKLSYTILATNTTGKMYSNSEYIQYPKTHFEMKVTKKGTAFPYSPTNVKNMDR
jgi:hypothetical protein